MSWQTGKLMWEVSDFPSTSFSPSLNPYPFIHIKYGKANHIIYFESNSWYIFYFSFNLISISDLLDLLEHKRSLVPVLRKDNDRILQFYWNDLEKIKIHLSDRFSEGGILKFEGSVNLNVNYYENSLASDSFSFSLHFHHFYALKKHVICQVESGNDGRTNLSNGRPLSTEEIHDHPKISIPPLSHRIFDIASFKFIHFLSIEFSFSTPETFFHLCKHSTLDNDVVDGRRIIHHKNSLASFPRNH